MPTATRPPAPVSILLSIVTAPAVWLERARGRKRVALLLLYGLAVSTIFVLIYRSTRLKGIPNIGEPFDVAAFMARPGSSSELENLYRQAWAKLRQRPNAGRDLHWRRWASVNAELRAWLEKNGEALSLWRKVADSPEPMHVFRLTSDSLQLPALALLEGARLEDEGRLSEAWGYYRALLRHSRQVEPRGSFSDRLCGTFCLKAAQSAILGWSGDPRLTGPQLRQALQEVLAIDGLTPPFSENLKAQYLMELKELEQSSPDFLKRLSRLRGEPLWYLEIPAFHWLRWEAGNEWERHRRILSLLIANWLPEADKPQPDRPAPFTASRLFDDPDAPPSARALPAEKLSGLLEGSAYMGFAEWMIPHLADQVESERLARADILYALAAQTYLREHGHLPATPEKLVGDLLPALPEDFDPLAGKPGPQILPMPDVPSPNDPWLETVWPLFKSE